MIVNKKYTFAYQDFGAIEHGRFRRIKGQLLGELPAAYCMDMQFTHGDINPIPVEYLNVMHFTRDKDGNGVELFRYTPNNKLYPAPEQHFLVQQLNFQFLVDKTYWAELLAAYGGNGFEISVNCVFSVLES